LHSTPRRTLIILEIITFFYFVVGLHCLYASLALKKVCSRIE
jgi:hypothetical protein